MSGDGQTILTSTYPSNSAPIDASFDGTVIAGFRSKGDYLSVEAFVNRNGQSIGLGKLAADDTGSHAWAVSADGNTVVGASHAHNGYGAIYRMTPFRWTPDTGMVSLGPLPGGTRAQANDVSGDGSVIVGQTMVSDRTEEAFRWTEATGMQPLGDLPGGSHFSDALAVSANGKVIVGTGKAESHLGGGVYDVFPEALIWTEHGGMQELRDVLMNEYNVDLQHYRLRSATGVSADGNIIVGLGAGLGSTFVWRVNLIPEPTAVMLVAIGLIALASARLPLAVRRMA
jgi:probable HAF family extracellular repeat protein